MLRVRIYWTPSFTILNDSSLSLRPFRAVTVLSKKNSTSYLIIRKLYLVTSLRSFRFHADPQLEKFEGFVGVGVKDDVSILWVLDVIDVSEPHGVGNLCLAD